MLVKSCLSYALCVCVCLPLLDPAIPATSHGTCCGLWTVGSQGRSQHVFKLREGVENDKE